MQHPGFAAHLTLFVGSSSSRFVAVGCVLTLGFERGGSLDIPSARGSGAAWCSSLQAGRSVSPSGPGKSGRHVVAGKGKAGNLRLEEMPVGAKSTWVARLFLWSIQVWSVPGCGFVDGSLFPFAM